jgi:hypothetical protein
MKFSNSKPTLGAVTDKSQSVILEVLLELGYRPVCALKDGLFGSSKVESLDSSFGLETWLSAQLFLRGLAV